MSLRILIADDEPPARARLRGLVEELGHEVCAEAADGLAAERLLRDTRPDAMLLGHLHLNRKQWQQAREAFDAALRRSPVSPRLLTARALVEFEAGEFREALVLLQRALDWDPDYPPALYNLGLLYRGNPDTRSEAEAAFRRFLAAAGDAEPGIDSPELLRRLNAAQDFLQSASEQRQPEAEPAPESEPERAPDPTSADESPSPPPSSVEAPSPPPKPAPERSAQPPPPREHPAVALLRQANAAIANESFDEALIILNQAVTRHPDHADTLWALIALYDRHLKFRTEAREAYALFRKRFPDDPRQTTIRPEPKPAPKPASPPEPAPKPDEPPTRPAPVRTEPVRPPAPAPVGSSDTRQAMRFWAQGKERQDRQDWAGAIAAYRQAVKKDPALFSAWYNLGLAYRSRGDAENARRAFMRAVRIKPADVRTQYMLAVVCFDAKRFDEAIGHLNQALLREPNHAQAHYLLGLIHSQQARPGAARRHFQRFLQLEPDGAAAERVRIWMEKHVDAR